METEEKINSWEDMLRANEDWYEKELKYILIGAGMLTLSLLALVIAGIIMGA